MNVNKRKISFSHLGIPVGITVLLFSMVFAGNPFLSFSSRFEANSNYYFDKDSNNTQSDSDTAVVLPYPFKDRVSDKYSLPYGKSPLYMNDPSNVQSTIEYSREPGNYGEYNINESIGKRYYRNPSYLTFDEYVEKEYRNSTKKYWKQRANEESMLQKKALIPKLHVNNEIFDRIFGGTTVDIRPQGSAELTFQIKRSTNENPAYTIRQQKPPPNFDFDQKIQMSVMGNIGDKMKLNTTYNTEAMFDFDNQIKLEYTGKEDEIIKKIEAGNVGLPLTGTLITGSQSLFGIKTALQFGHLTVTSVFSQQKGKKTTQKFTGGAQTNFFEIKADQYEANKHFFLSQYFRNRYDAALAGLPVVRSSVNISKVEVWVVGKTGAVENIRSIVAFMDLGEAKYYNKNGIIAPDSNTTEFPSNTTNTLYRLMLSGQYSGIRNIKQANDILSGLCGSADFCSSVDYKAIEYATKLSTNEYTVNNRLGYISLNRTLNADEVLAVAFEYTVGDKIYKVGEFSSGGINAPQALIVKLLKGANVNPRLPTWDLMMKNIYSINSYNITNKNFTLDVLYDNAATGIPANYIPVKEDSKVNGVPLIRLLNLDRLNSQNSQQPDGVFDFVDGITINISNGRVIFPCVEPFGSYLRSKFTPENQKTLADNYTYDFLYDSTKTRAQQDLEHNKFIIKGSYESNSSSELSLNAFNIPEGAVTVTAGGIKLVENTDYTLDRMSGKVKIINSGVLNSGTPIEVSVESNSLFNLQTKTLWGSRFDYLVSKDVNVGATILHLSERPFTQKVSIGDEPISNTIWGLDGTYRSDSRFITKIVDKLPFYSTKAPSNVTVSGEFAHLIPGHSRYIGKKGTSYVDDFEGTKTPIDIKSYTGWILASTPRGQSYFPEAELNNNLTYGYNRAKLAWYSIDPYFYENNAPDEISGNNELLSNHFSRQVLETELFPSKNYPPGTQSIALSVLNLAYYPKERGPYNYDITKSSYSAGLEADGFLKNPKTRWAGIMRKLETTDFEASNVEFIEFWLMDPFVYKQASGGDLYFNLGDISEDVLRDGQKAFENGLPISDAVKDVDTTVWGRIPTIPAMVNAFDNNASSRPYQDVGFDGLSDSDERNFFKNYIDSIGKIFTTSSGAYAKANTDPSADNYHYYRGSDLNGLNILDRYIKYNGPDGNSVTSQNSPESYPTSATNIPDGEDVNKDNNCEQEENYYQYRVELKPDKMVIGQNYITDIVTGTGKLKNGKPADVKWYQFKIPLKTPDKVVGNISDFKSIRFLRMFLRGFDDTVICRFARLQLIRSEWRKYDFDMQAQGEYITTDNSNETVFDISTVNLEENGTRKPIKYVLPPGFERPIDPGSPSLTMLNEQSLMLKTCNLMDGDARAAYKNTTFDIRNYKKLKMFIHAEASGNTEALKNGDLTIFIRMGSDFTSNYYEYEMPLIISPWDAARAEDIWKDSLELDLNKLYAAKQRWSEMVGGSSGKYTAIMESPPFKDGNNIIRIKGNPKLNEVKVMMLGIRNPKKTPLTPTDDGLPKCGEIWVNELRLSDFSNEGGWAANARVTTKLADLATLNLAGSIRSFGFGSLEEKMNEREKKESKQYDAALSQLELGKFLPTAAGLKIPMYVSYSQAWVRPKYDPNSPDIPLKTALNAASTDSIRKEILKASEDYTERKSLNFTNVKKDKVKSGAKTHFYDIENVTLSYAYTETFKRSETILSSTEKTHRGGMGYVFNNSPKNIAPLSKSKALKGKYMKLLKDFNFYYMPSSFAFRADLDRYYKETFLRNANARRFPEDTFKIAPTFNKKFSMTRLYDLKFDLTKTLKFDFQATNNSEIDEPEGRINKHEADYGQKMKVIKNNLYKLHLGGRTTKYHHTGNLSYTLPINKIPLTDWISSTARYSFGYDWTTAPLKLDSADNQLKPDNSIGNTIQNSNTKQLTGDFNLVTLYNKVPYLKNINNKKPDTSKKPDKKQEKKSKTPAPKKPLKTKEDSLKAKKDSLDKITIVDIILEKTAKVLMSTKRASITYSETNGTLIPGYTKKTELMGMSHNFKAPTVGFIFGDQKDIKPLAGRKEWLSTDTMLNTLSTQTYLTNLSARASIEPLQNLKIELTANRNFSRNESEYFKWDNTINQFKPFSKIETGNFSMSFLSVKTAFEKEGENHSSKAFDKFRENRQHISERLSDNNKSGMAKKQSSLGYREGYSSTSQEVLIPAFMAAYSGQEFYKVPINAPFPSIPLPNWRITYDGFSKFEWAQKYFSSVSVSHSYRSTYTIGSYTTNLAYKEINGSASIFNDKNDFLSQYEINQVSISEQFAPLFSVDMSWKNSLLTRFEYKKDRSISLNLTNGQLAETKGKEMVIGAGYRIKQFPVPFKIKGKKIKLKNDLDCKGDIGIRKNLTITRRMEEDVNQVTGGMTTITIKLSVDYIINERFNTQVFYERSQNRPEISTSFKTTNWAAGIRVRFTLAT